MKQDMISHKHKSKCPRTYQCPQVSVYFQIATFLQLMNMLRIVILTLLCIFVCCAFAGDSYEESKPGNEKRKSDEVSGSYRVTKHRRKQSHSRTRKKTAYNYSDSGGTLKKIEQPKTLI